MPRCTATKDTDVLASCECLQFSMFIRSAEYPWLMSGWVEQLRTQQTALFTHQESLPAVTEICSTDEVATLPVVQVTFSREVTIRLITGASHWRLASRPRRILESTDRLKRHGIQVRGMMPSPGPFYGSDLSDAVRQGRSGNQIPAEHRPDISLDLVPVAA